MSKRNGALVSQSSTNCSPDLDLLYLNRKPFYSPHEFSSFILVCVCIPPQANANTVQQTLADQVNKLELKDPESPLIFLGGFNRAQLNHEIPKYKQHSVSPEKATLWTIATRTTLLRLIPICCPRSAGFVTV